MKWRWDQGRLDYFQFDEIRRIAIALTPLNGIPLPKGSTPDVLRTALAAHSTRPFAPKHYKVWRNYKRVFGCEMLAADVAGHLCTTDLCSLLAADALTVDEYLLHIATRFSYPSPVFEGYAPSGNPVYPICAIVKFLVAEFLTSAKPLVSIDEIIDRVKGNGVAGDEPLVKFTALPKTGVKLSESNDEFRQIRELVIFISQFSFLKWQNPNLILDVGTHEAAKNVAALMAPAKLAHDPAPGTELLNLGGNVHSASLPELVGASEMSVFDHEFVEGNKQRVTHLRAERSGKLRQFYFKHQKHPHVCRMCTMVTTKHYPWAERLVELHHLLPLSSPVRVDTQSTSLKDLVGLCPTCHRATHKFYSTWLKSMGQKDFGSKAEAHSVFEQATKDFVALCPH